VTPALGACGDSVLDGGETCDDGNTVDADGCDYPSCTITTGWICGSAMPSVCGLADCGSVVTGPTVSVSVSNVDPGPTANPITETSGVSISSFDDALVWTLDDGANEPWVYAVGRTTGNMIAAFVYTRPASSGTNADTESMDLGPGPIDGHSYLYIWDNGLGGNNNWCGPADTCTTTYIFRIDEQELRDAYFTETGNDLDGLEANNAGGDIDLPSSPNVLYRMKVQFPSDLYGGTRYNQDMEGMFVDPQTKDIFIITKRGPSTAEAAHLLRIPLADQVWGQAAGDATVTLTDVGTLPWDSSSGTARAVGADITDDGGLIGVSHEGWAYGFFFLRDSTETVTEAMTGYFCRDAITNGPQNESIAFDSDGREFVTISEGGSPDIREYNSEFVRCGDNYKEGVEVCDDLDFGSATCATIVGTGSTGTLVCNALCDTIDSSGCSAAYAASITLDGASLVGGGIQ